MTQTEALRLALEALEKVTKQMLAIRDELAERGGRPTNNFVHKELWDSSFDVYLNCAIPTAEAIKAALEAKDEPVAWYVERQHEGFRDHGLKYGPFWKRDDALEWCDDNHFLKNLYTTPPPVAEPHKRTWQSLTDEEIDDIPLRQPNGYAGFARAIEAKLRSKNYD